MKKTYPGYEQNWLRGKNIIIVIEGPDQAGLIFMEWLSSTKGCPSYSSTFYGPSQAEIILSALGPSWKPCRVCGKFVMEMLEAFAGKGSQKSAKKSKPKKINKAVKNAPKNKGLFKTLKNATILEYYD